MARLHQTTYRTLIVLALHLVISPLQARSKTDVIYMKNSDRITFEIKYMEKGQLAIKIGYMIGTHLVDWSEVERIESSQQFQVLWSDGDMNTGILKQELEDPEDATGEATKTLSVESSYSLRV